ncbi:MAG: hypothetical protein ABR589_02115 [Chthoniobacterales bacterium]
MPAASLRALLEHSIDYAGLFPPATLALEPALRNHANYVRDSDAWMLGAFVLPVGQFDEAAEMLGWFDVEHALRVSALGPRSENAAEFIAALERVAEAIRHYQAERGAVVAVAQIEMALPAQPGATVTEARQVLAGVESPAFWEAAADEAERTIATIAEHNRSTGAQAFGFKLRTGGVIASAFPSSMQIARALVAAARHDVPIKFTAGLHHPVRQFHSSVQTKMHGFLNVLGAGVLAAEHKWEAVQTAAMLDDEDASAFAFTDESFRWREWEIPTERIRAQRALVTSLGSCSFDEPREDLRALNLL